MVSYEDLRVNKRLTDYETVLVLVCPYCGRDVLSSDYFCNHCNYKLKKVN